MNDQQMIDYLLSEMRHICAVTPDFDGEEDDDSAKVGELGHCLASAQRIAGRALREGGRHLAARAPSPAVGMEVTWEEAEQVAQQFCNTAIGVRSWSKFCHVEQLDIIVEMRAALEAFVRGRGKS